MSRRYHSKSDDQVGFIVIVLLAGTLWAHRVVMLRVERIALVITFVISGLLCSVTIIKFMRRLLRWHNRHNSSLADIDQMSGLEFERYVAQLLKRQGYRSIRLTEKYDYGVDITAEKDGMRFGIQVKRYSGLVGASSVRQVVTALKFYGCDKAIVITNSKFSKVAKHLADSNDCKLIDRDKLKVMVRGHIAN